MDCFGSNVANKDFLRDKRRETRTNNQNLVVCKKQLSSWNCFYGLGLSQHRQLRNFWAKGESEEDYEPSFRRPPQTTTRRHCASAKGEWSM